jgi:O-antigen ligase
MDGSAPDRGARRLAAVAACLLVAMPVAMWLANRSAPLVLALAACACLAAVARSGELRAAAGRTVGTLRTPLGLSLAAFLGWSLLSLGWSHRPAAGFAMWCELALPILAGLVIALSGRFRPSPALLRALAFALIAASLFMGIELASGMSQRLALGIGRPQSYIFNRPAIVCLLLLAPLVWRLWRGAARDRVICLTALASVVLLVIGCDSGAAKLGLLVMVATWALVLIMPRAALALVAAATLATIAIAPVIGQLADRAFPPALHTQLQDSHSRDRVDIWLSFGEAIRARPLLGSGFGASPTLDRHPVAAEVSPPRRVLLAVGHPHSAPVQAWVETGFVGAACLAFAALACLARLRRLAAADLAPRLALYAAAFAIAAVGHGAWQGWWIAALAAAILWFGTPSHRQGHEHG